MHNARQSQESQRPLKTGKLVSPRFSASRFRSMAHSFFYPAVVIIVMMSVAACQQHAATRPASTQKIQRTHQGDNTKVVAALNQWPEEAKRPFFATIHAAGRRVVAIGVFDYHNSHDFRITTVTELGQILFDARCNWAGCKVVRTMPGLPENVIEMLCRDLSLAWRIPSEVRNMELKKNEWVYTYVDAERFHFTHYFNPDDGRLKRTEIQLGVFDTLTVDVQSYDSQGWPTELVLSRPARAYTIQLSFLNQP